MNNRILSKLWVVFMSIILLSVSSCGLPYCIKVPFSENDLNWMKPYSVGDTLIFENSENVEFDTIIVKEKEIFNPSNNIFDLEGCNWMEGDNEYKAVAGYDFDGYHSGVRYFCGFTIKKNCKSKPAVVSISLFGRYSKHDISTNNIVKDISIFPQYKINIVVPDSNLQSGIHQPVRPISSIYWNQEIGLIGYRTSHSLYKLVKIKK